MIKLSNIINLKRSGDTISTFLRSLFSKIIHIEYDEKANSSPYNTSEAMYSIMSSVYRKTDAKLFLKTVNSVLSQTVKKYEWIVLAHGPISQKLNTILTNLGRKQNIRVYWLEENIGIIGAMRFCLMKAKYQYAIPLDADDLITNNALFKLTEFITQNNFPPFIYTDEDILVGGKCMSPYLRPDWDPVLNYSSSYIWHLCAFSVDIAKKIGVYSDKRFEYCHDWDTVFRFYNAKQTIAHLPEILYHWRQHSNSTSNSEIEATDTTLLSTRNLLNAQIGAMKDKELYYVEEFPLFRGAKEFHIARAKLNPKSIKVFINLSSNSYYKSIVKKIKQGKCYPIDKIYFLISKCCDDKSQLQKEGSQLYEYIDGEIFDTLQQFKYNLYDSYIMIVDGVVPDNFDSLMWEAIKYFEMVSKTALLSCRIIDENNYVIGGGEIFDKDKLVCCLDKGRKYDDPGTFALSLKPHIVNCVNSKFFFSEGNFLADNLERLPTYPENRNVGCWLSAVAKREKRYAVYSPLLYGKLHPEINNSECDYVFSEEEKNYFCETYNDCFESLHVSHYRYYKKSRRNL